MEESSDSSFTPSPSPAEEVQAEPEETGKMLERLTLQFLDIIATSEIDSPLVRTYISSAFSSKMIGEEHSESHLCSPSLPQFFAVYKSKVDTDPEYRIEILDSTVHMHEKGNRAIVWVTWRVKAYRKNERTVTRDAVSKCEWRKASKKDRWVYVKHVGITGSGAPL
jgi:hypothetical protein